MTVFSDKDAALTDAVKLLQQFKRLAMQVRLYGSEGGMAWSREVALTGMKRLPRRG